MIFFLYLQKYKRGNERTVYKILRFLMFVLVVALGCIGYNIYEDTLAAVWIPVGVGLVVAVVTLPLYKNGYG